METAALKDVFLVCLRWKKNASPHMWPLLALAEAGGLAEVLPKDFLPRVFLVRSNRRIGELCQCFYSWC